MFQIGTFTTVKMINGEWKKFEFNAKLMNITLEVATEKEASWERK